MTVFLLLAVALLAFGYGVGLYRVRAQRYRLDALRRTLDIEWNAMYQMQRMSQVYLATSEALRPSEDTAYTVYKPTDWQSQ